MPKCCTQIRLCAIEKINMTFSYLINLYFIFPHIYLRSKTGHNVKRENPTFSSFTLFFQCQCILKISCNTSIRRKIPFNFTGESSTIIAKSLWYGGLLKFGWTLISRIFLSCTGGAQTYNWQSGFVSVSYSPARITDLWKSIFIIIYFLTSRCISHTLVGGPKYVKANEPGNLVLSKSIPITILPVPNFGQFLETALFQPLYQSEEMKILNIWFPRQGIESTICRVYSHRLVSLHHDGLNLLWNY